MSKHRALVVLLEAAGQKYGELRHQQEFLRQVPMRQDHREALDTRVKELGEALASLTPADLKG